MAILKSASGTLKNLIFGKAKKLAEWLIEITEMLTHYGYKENKKGRIKLEELLQLKDKIEDKGFIFAEVKRNSHQHQIYQTNTDGLKNKKQIYEE